jgi:hypothetical protein
VPLVRREDTSRRSSSRRPLSATATPTRGSSRPERSSILCIASRAVVPEDAAYTNSATEHARGIARMTGAGVERNHCKGLVFEWLHTVDRAIEDFPKAKALGTPPWRL